MNDNIVRAPAEILYAEELSALKANDGDKLPLGWHLSPKAVKTFIVGSDGTALKHEWQGRQTETVIPRKFYGDDVLIDRLGV